MLGHRQQIGSASESNSEPGAILTLLRLPGRVNAEQTAALIGFAPWDIPLLVKARLLKPLGRGAANRRERAAQLKRLRTADSEARRLRLRGKARFDYLKTQVGLAPATDDAQLRRMLNSSAKRVER